MTPWKWNDENNLWINSTTNETMTAIEYDNLRCVRILELEAALRKILKIQSVMPEGDCFETAQRALRGC